MKEHIFIGAYWTIRKETRQECAERIVKFLNSISNQPYLSNWYFKARSRKAANKPVKITIENIAKHLKTSNRDDNGAEIVELGFSLGVWNGNDENPVSFNVECGAFSKFIGNAAVITLPLQEPPLDEDSIKTFKNLLEKFIDAWEPESAVVTSNEFLNRAGGGLPADIGGWLIYRHGKGIEIKNN